MTAFQTSLPIYAHLLPDHPPSRRVRKVDVVEVADERRGICLCQLVQVRSVRSPCLVRLWQRHALTLEPCQVLGESRRALKACLKEATIWEGREGVRMGREGEME